MSYNVELGGMVTAIVPYEKLTWSKKWMIPNEPDCK
jgi:hypothetical protein